MQKMNTPSTYTSEEVTKQEQAAKEFNYSLEQLSIATSIGWLTRMEKGLVIYSQWQKKMQYLTGPDLLSGHFCHLIWIFLYQFSKTTMNLPQYTYSHADQ